MANLRIAISLPYQELAEFCHQHHIRKLALFGSVLRDDFDSESDVDRLVEFEPGSTVTLLDMAAQEIALSAIIGRKVDLRTAEELSRYFRQKVVEMALPV
jgi:uncharacterized protein